MAVDYEVFISYRHAENNQLAACLHRYLLDHYAIDSFRDAEELHFGDFRKQLVLNNLRSQYLLLLLTPTTLEKCHNPNDWVAREIFLFLKLGKPIIPVKLQGFTYPQLPERLQGLLQHDHRAIVCDIADPRRAAEQICQQLIGIVRQGWDPEVIQEAQEQKAFLEKGNPDISSYFCQSALDFRKEFLLFTLSLILSVVLFCLKGTPDHAAYSFLLTYGMMVLLAAERKKLPEYSNRSLIDVLLDTELLQIRTELLQTLLVSLLYMFAALLAGFLGTLLGVVLGTLLNMLDMHHIDPNCMPICMAYICVLVPTGRYLFRFLHRGSHFLNAAFGRYPRKFLTKRIIDHLVPTLRIVGWVLLAPAMAICAVLALL